MKTNMKAALLFITVPLTISFFAGMFEWYIEDGMYILLGLSMIIGIIWAWIAESNRNK